MVLKLVHSENTFPSMYFSFFGKSICVRELQFVKIPDVSVSRLSGKVTFSKLVQLLNAPLSIHVTLDGISTSF